MREIIGTVKAQSALKLRAVIQEGARVNNLVKLNYQKRNGKNVVRLVLPYSYRGHLFFGKDAHTKSFIFDRIRKAALTALSEKPDYKVEL